MDRIAIISDIHGNLPALEATLADIRGRGIQRIACLGDLAGKGPSADVVVDRCRAICEWVVQGNWDDGLLAETDHPTLQWHRERLGRARLEYLGQLPAVVEFTISGKRVRLFHASQQGVYTRVYMNDTPEKHAAMFENTPFTGDGPPPDVVGYGDIHDAYVKTFRSKILFNAGSVGNPLDMTQAAYAILEGRYASEAPSGFGIQIVRVPYDIERAIRDAEQAGMPELEAYASELRTGRYRGAGPAA